MCAPAIPIAIAAASVAMQAGSAAASYSGQQAAAGAQSSYEKAAYLYNKKSATANYLQEVNQIQERSQQQYAQSADQDTQQKLQGEAGKGKAAVAFGQRGVGGNSTNEALREFDRIEMLNHGNLVRNYNFQMQQAGQDELAARASANDRIASMTPQPVQYPSALAAGFNFGNIALQGFNQIYQATPKQPDNYSTGAPTAPPPPQAIPGT